VNDPAQVTDRAYNTFDMRVTYTPTGTPGEYQAQGWVRLHKAASTDEMAIRPGTPPWGSPFTWVWNTAMNNQADPEDAWVPFFDGSWVITGDYTSAHPYAEIMNWGVPQTRYHTFSWDSMVVEGTPAPVDEVCVDDDFSGSNPGDSLDGSVCGMGTVTFGYDAFATIQDGVDAVSGSTVHVAAGTYAEGVNLTPGQDVAIAGAGRDVVTWACPSGGYCVGGNMSGYTGNMSYEISGFTFNVRSDPAMTWGTGIQIYRASSGPLSLSIHDNRFTEDRASGDTDHWGTSMFLCHNRYAARDGSGNAPVHIYDNIDETWGGMTMSNSQAYDIYHNVFDGCSDAIYNGHGCPDTAGQTFGDHHIYANTFMNASDDLHPGGMTPAIDWQYYGAGGATHLPSLIENNLFQDNDTAMRFVMDTDMTYPAHVVTGNSFVGNGTSIRVAGAFASLLNASGNWWGTDAAAGVAAQVTDDVDYTPWLADGSDTSADPGFQGDFSELWVDDDSPQSGTSGRVQEGIDMVSGSTVYVAAGTYNERVMIDKSVDLRGAQYGVDPTATGARTDAASESIVDVTALGYANPDIAVEILSGVSGVALDGFTLVGDPTNALADTSVIRCGGSSGSASDVSISNNIIDGKYGVIYKGGDALTVHRNRFVVNKLGVTIQPNPASGVMVSDNLFSLGSAPASDTSAVYMTGCLDCSVTANTATGFSGGRGLGGSNLTQLTVSDNTFTGNRDAISVWGSSTYVAIRDNDLSGSVRYGVNIKGQDIEITGNEINGSGNAGINVARHVIDTERVEVHYNNITGSTNYGLQVDAAVTEIVDATCNWWGAADGPSGAGPGSGDAVTGGALFDPWLLGPAPDGPCGCSIEVQKYHDLNKNGDRDLDEPGLAGWEFTLYDAQDNPLTAGLTGPGGLVSFGNLASGAYKVCESLPEGWVNSDPGNVCQTVVVGNGVGAPGPDAATLTADGNSYLIEFLGTSDEGLTWNYRVTELEGKDLSHWILGLCMEDAVTAWEPTEVDAGIKDVELVYPDPTTGIGGIKWDVEDDFNTNDNDDGDSREFSFTLDAVYPVGTTEVGVKTGGQGEQTATGFIAGPHCGGNPAEAVLVFGNYEEGGTAVTLAAFTAEPGVGSVTLAWETGTEIDNAGFNLYRASAADGPYVKVNHKLIAAEGDPVAGAGYSFLDKGLESGTYYYKLEDVDLNGVTTRHGPVSATVLPRLRRPSYRPTLP
jgi:hypothetical protein